jgi:hypothetical protein
MMNTVPADQKTRPLIVLNQRAFELKASIHEGFTMTWNKLVDINAESGKVTIDSSSGMRYQHRLISHTKLSRCNHQYPQSHHYHESLQGRGPADKEAI